MEASCVGVDGSECEVYPFTGGISAFQTDSINAI